MGQVTSSVDYACMYPTLLMDHGVCNYIQQGGAVTYWMEGEGISPNSFTYTDISETTLSLYCTYTEVARAVPTNGQLRL